MDNYTPLDCKHCACHYINGRRERLIGDDWCSEPHCVKVRDERYEDMIEQDFKIIIKEDK